MLASNHSRQSPQKGLSFQLGWGPATHATSCALLERLPEFSSTGAGSFLKPNLGVSVKILTGIAVLQADPDAQAVETGRPELRLRHLLLLCKSPHYTMRKAWKTFVDV